MKKRKSIVVCGAGHHPAELGAGYERRRLVQLATSWLQKHQPRQLISGMAPGWDQALAVAALTLAIPVVAAIPYSGYEQTWNAEDQQLYHEILELASEVHFVAEGLTEDVSDLEKKQQRNRWMVDRSDKVVALWNGSQSDTTAHCIAYARSVQKPVDNLWERWVK